MKHKRIKDDLRELGVRPTKERGQNFLHDASVLEQLVMAGAPKPEDTIVEIGPGLGAMTGELARFPNLTVIEIEPRFCEELKNRHPQIKIIQSDVRLVDFSKIGKKLLVYGNLPYSMSTEILFHLVSHGASIDRAVLLLQKEFVDRMAAPPGGREYGTLSIAVQLWANIKPGMVVDGECFHPPTKVQSRIVELKFLGKPRIDVGDTEFFRRVIKACFHKRRKILINSIEASHFFPEVDLKQVLAQAEIDPECRAETLKAEDFARLARILAARP